MQHNRHLIIFIKNPVLGKVKTRLAAGIGEKKALDVYQQLLEITRNAALKSDCTRNVFYSDEIENDAWDEDKFNKFVQEGDSLGDRMKNAFMQVFALGATEAIIIGSDCPELNADIIHQAFEVLDEKDAVIGPAKDGGYYLLGMKKLLPFVFENKEWSTDSVFTDTTNNLETNKLSYGLVRQLSDLDNITDLRDSKLNFME
ncbi:MAG: TIGR04282 family arsenosugar biosynthesis glycosyltransferase [Flavobacteriales bacterium]|nr:TIGR04282 family arsenosugar biosynthesis glycosyltransferase [Flavobacteriales bacterium]